LDASSFFKKIIAGGCDIILFMFLRDFTLPDRFSSDKELFNE
jgi:hypothetical protein